jgi:hypothetical protein
MLALGHPTMGKHFAQVNVDLILGSKASRDSAGSPYASPTPSRFMKPIRKLRSVGPLYFMAASFIGSGRKLRAEEVN